MINHDFTKAIELILSSKSILIVSHRRPDGDTLGCAVAFNIALQKMGKKTLPVCIDEIPKRFHFLPRVNDFRREFDLNKFDLIIINDAGAHHMTGFHEKNPDFLSKKVPIINIDHHSSNEGFGTINIVDPSASSATMIVWQLFKAMAVEINSDIATALLAGIYNDTGGFMHSNTTKETFEIAWDLSRVGVDVEKIIRPLFKESSLSQLRLWGYILENLRVNDKKVLASVIDEGSIKILGVRGSDTGGIIDLINTVPNVDFSILLAEDEEMVKGSLRTQRDDVNVSDIASRFGGGGHKKAAGFRLHGKLEKHTVWKIIPADKPHRV